MPRQRKKSKVALFGNINRSAFVEDGATVGATIGEDLYFADGSVVTLAALAAALGVLAAATQQTSSGIGGVSSTIWSLISEIPANVVEVEELATSGLVVRQASGDWITRSIAVASTDRLTIANGDGDAGAPTLDLADLEGLSLWGRSATTTGKPDAITGVANQVARVNSAGTVLEFGAVNLASSAAVTGRLPFANIAQITGPAVLGVAGAGAADLAAISTAADDRVLSRTSGTLAFTQLTSGMFPNLVVPDAALSANVVLEDAFNVWTAPSQTISSSNPNWALDNTSAAANSRLWLMIATGLEWQVRAYRDDLSGATAPIRVVRATGTTTIDLIALASTALTSTGALAVTHVRTNAAGTITASSTIPSFRLEDTDAGSDEKQWEWYAQGGALHLATLTDAGGATADAIVLDRTGTVVDSIALTATSLTLTGATLLSGGTSTTAPAARVGQAGTASLATYLSVYVSGSDASFLVERASGPAALVYCSTTDAIYGSFTNHPVQIHTNNTTRVTIAAAGTVGIGQSPVASQALAVFSANAQLQFGNGSGQGYLHGTGGAIAMFSGNTSWPLVFGFANDGSGIDNTMLMIAGSGIITIGEAGQTPQHALNVSVATGATGGADTLPANPVGFIVVTLNGTTRKIPYYAN